MSGQDRRLESSIPVQSRISIVELAKMHRIWESRGVHISTMSQLVSWTFTAMVEVLEDSGKYDVKVLDKVVSAHQYLRACGIYQKGVMRRSKSRVSAALQLETLRDEGFDPSYHAPMQYKVIHSPHAHQPYNGEFRRKEPIDFSSPDEVARREKELEELKKQTVQSARDSGLIVEEREEIEKKFAAPRRLTGAELDEKEAEVLERDRERMKLENAPIDMDALGDSLVEEIS